MNRLKFYFGNKKLANYICHFSLPSGWTCPGAKECYCKVCPLKGKLKQFGKRFRCYSASEEAVFPTVRKARWYNFNLLKKLTKREMVKLIKLSMPGAIVVRLHVGGDFFSQAYFDAWVQVAKDRPETLFYAYTKSLNFWVKRLGQIPANLKLVASKGGKFDHLIEKHNLNFSEVVFSEEEAKAKGFRIDSDDSIAQKGNENFLLMIHGQGEKGSRQAQIQAQRRWIVSQKNLACKVAK